MTSRLPAFLAAAVLAACTSGSDASRPSLVLTDCRLPGVETMARCGTYEVWEDREAKSGRRLALRVAIVPAKARARDADPIVVLAGGPGQGAVGLASQVMPLFARLNDSRDVVFLDQRGTGESAPLACEEETQPLQSLFEDALPERLVTRCLAQLDADPRLYVTSIAMEDLDEVRAALGYAKVNLWGGSYGTRAALEYIRRHGANVRSAVLDGVAPATMKLPLSFVADGDAALARLIEACEQEGACRKNYPDLRVMIDSLRGQLSRRPARAAIQDPRTGERANIQVNENVFLSGLFRPLYVAELASLLPYGISAATAGDFNPLLAQNLELADDIAENPPWACTSRSSAPRTSRASLPRTSRPSGARSSAAPWWTTSCAPARSGRAARFPRTTTIPSSPKSRSSSSRAASTPPRRRATATRSWPRCRTGATSWRRSSPTA
jgi:pimeloyl-ACP methyl ester carboxylesterase